MPAMMDYQPMTLLEMRDELAAVRDFLTVLWLASSSPMHSGNGSALCTVVSAARERIEAICEGLDEHLSGSRATDGSL